MDGNKKRSESFSPEERRQAGRLLVVMLSAFLIFLLLSIFPAALLMVRFFIWMPMEPPQHGIGVLFAGIVVLVVFLVPLSIFTIIGSIIWYFLMSFYLTVQEYRWMNSVPSPYIPLITSVITNISEKMLNWKIERERKKK